MSISDSQFRKLFENAPALREMGPVDLLKYAPHFFSNLLPPERCYILNKSSWSFLKSTFISGRGEPLQKLESIPSMELQLEAGAQHSTGKQKRKESSSAPVFHFYIFIFSRFLPLLFAPADSCLVSHFKRSSLSLDRLPMDVYSGVPGVRALSVTVKNIMARFLNRRVFSLIYSKADGAFPL